MSSENSPHPSGFPYLLTVAETAELLRTTPKAIYSMVERAQLPGVVRPSRKRVLIKRDDLLAWLEKRHAPSPEGAR